MVKNTIKFLASTSAPNPKEVDYWVDTMEDPAGAIIKVFRNNKWEPLNDTPEGYKELENKVDALDKEVGKVKDEISKFGSAQGIVELQIGNSDEVKEVNLSALQGVSSTDHTFFVDIDYGYGTGQWLPSVGGSAFIITSEGHAVAYTIGSDGAVIKSAEFSLGQKATTASDGLMSKEDKTKLDSMIQIPSGGAKGQVLTKGDTGVEWADAAAGDTIPTITLQGTDDEQGNISGKLTAEQKQILLNNKIVNFVINVTGSDTIKFCAPLTISSGSVFCNISLVIGQSRNLTQAMYQQFVAQEDGTDWSLSSLTLSTASASQYGLMTPDQYTKLEALPTKAELDAEVDWYGVSWNDGDQDSKLVRTGNLSLHKSLPIQSAMRGCVVLSDTTGVKDGTVLYLNNDWSGVLANNGIDVDLTKENIMVEIPEYWYIDEYTPSTHHHELKISAIPQAGWFKHKKSYVSAYEGFVDENGVYKSLKGQIPTVSKSREQFRTAVRLNGPTTESKWNIYTYAEHRAICHLFMVEYATRYSQDTIKTLDANGYHQGGLGDGCTGGSIKVNGVTTYAFIPTGSSDVLGNGTGEVLVQVTSTDAEGATSTTSKKCNRYRGIENPFGHVWKHCDDVISKFDTNTQKRSYFMCEDPSKFSTNYTIDYKFLCTDDAQTKNGWKITVVPTTHGDLFTMNIIDATSSTKHWTDYNFDNRTEGERCLLIGGNSDSGSNAGLVYFASGSGVGDSNVNIGCRVTYNI